jgi:glycosyltransferase involved in cell wall biosynthesis
MLLSIIIPTRNRHAMLLRCLSSLRRETGRDGDVEIIVVDDCSEPHEAALNREACAGIGADYLGQTNRTGAAGARNAGLAQSTSEWAVFVDDDVTACEGWYFGLLSVLSGCTRDVVGVEGGVAAEGRGAWDREVANEAGGLFLTCNIAYRSEVLKREGGFDERFNSRFPCCEDHELAARMLRWGKILFAKQMAVTHCSREVRLADYLFRSVERMSAQLAAEFYFFEKQKDRYHRFRHRPTFFGTYAAILVKHTPTTLRRRRVAVLLRRPFQGFVLLLSCLIEQTYAWLCLPKYFFRYHESGFSFFDTLVDIPATMGFWKLDKTTPLRLFRVRPSFVNSLLFPLVRRPVYSALPALKRISAVAEQPSLRCFLRIDDVFFHEPAVVERMCGIISEIKIPFLAAVCGDQLVDPSCRRLIDLLRSSGGEIGVHGFSHEGRFGPFESEVLQLSFVELEERTEAIFQALGPGLRPLAFVAPFNAISRPQIAFLGSRFPIVCGGPETARFADRMLGPLALKNGAWYVPSLFPFYQSAAAVVRSRAVRLWRVIGGSVCITVHMPQEAEDGFAGLSALCVGLAGVAASWRCFTK